MNRGGAGREPPRTVQDLWPSGLESSCAIDPYSSLFSPLVMTETLHHPVFSVGREGNLLPIRERDHQTALRCRCMKRVCEGHPCELLSRGRARNFSGWSFSFVGTCTRNKSQSRAPILSPSFAMPLICSAGDSILSKSEATQTQLPAPAMLFVRASRLCLPTVGRESPVPVAGMLMVKSSRLGLLWHQVEVPLVDAGNFLVAVFLQQSPFVLWVAQRPLQTPQCLGLGAGRTSDVESVVWFWLGVCYLTVL